MRWSRLVLTTLIVMGAALRSAPSVGFDNRRPQRSQASLAARATVPYVRCDRVASPRGADAAKGSAAHPYRTLARLASSLSPGLTGCLRRGVYGGFSVQTNITRGGTRSARVTITSYPGERAEVDGFIYIASSASYVTLSRLNIRGANNFYPRAGGTATQPLIVDSTGFTFEDNDLSNGFTGIGLLLRNAASPLVRRNRIHAVGSNSGENHGIYISYAKDFQVIGNWIYNCPAGWGIQLYPDADRGVIRGNVIDRCGAGITFSAQGPRASEGNLFERNIVSNSLGMNGNRGFAVSGWFNAAVPTGNVARDNVFYNNAAGDYDGFAGTSYAGSANSDADPKYVARARADFRLRRGSPARGIWNGVFRTGLKPRRR